MRAHPFLLAALSCLAVPAAAQTIPSPTPNQPAAGVSRLDNQNREAALVNKMRSVNDAGDFGYDVIVFNNRDRNVQGSPFLVGGWSNGEVRTSPGERVTPGVLKFDAFAHQVRLRRPAGDSIIIESARLRGFVLRPGLGGGAAAAERRFERLPDGAVPEVAAAFAETLSSGNEVRLLKLQRKFIVKGRSGSGGYTAATPDAFENLTQYYLRWADGTCVPVKPNSGSLLASVALRKPAEAAAEKLSKTKARTDAELAALVQRVDAVLAAHH